MTVNKWVTRHFKSTVGDISIEVCVADGNDHHARVIVRDKGGTILSDERQSVDQLRAAADTYDEAISAMEGEDE